MNPERWNRDQGHLRRGAGARAGASARRYVEQACASDAELRAEVISLLAAHDTAEDFIEQEAAQRVGLASAAPKKDWIGRRLGPYRIVDEAGRGGMSQVFKAVRDDQQYEKQVAIKLLKPGLDTDSLLRRFKAERQILAQLSHPNIAHLLDGGATEEGAPYLVMEYIEGKPIDVYCDDRDLGVSERLDLFRSLCSAVHYVHQHLMVHGDLKRGNVLVTQQGVVKLLDFGIAKLLSPTPRRTRGAARDYVPCADARVREPRAGSRRSRSRQRATSIRSAYCCIACSPARCRTRRRVRRRGRSRNRSASRIPPPPSVTADCSDDRLRSFREDPARRSRQRRAQSAEESAGRALRLGGATVRRPAALSARIPRRSAAGHDRLSRTQVRATSPVRRRRRRIVRHCIDRRHRDDELASAPRGCRAIARRASLERSARAHAAFTSPMSTTLSPTFPAAPRRASCWSRTRSSICGASSAMRRTRRSCNATWRCL